MRFLITLTTVVTLVSADAEAGIESLWTFDESSYVRIALSHDQLFVAGKAEGNAAVEIRAVSSRDLVSRLDLDSGTFPADMRFSHDGKFLVISDYDSTVKLWDVESAELVRVFYTREQKQPVSFSTDSKYLFFGNAAMVEKWMLPEIERVDTWPALTGGWLVAMDVSPDGTRVVTGMGIRGFDKNVRAWSAETGDLVFERATSLSYGVGYIAHSFDGALLATYREFGTGTCEIWNATDGTWIAEFDSYSWTQALSFSGDGNAVYISAYRRERIDGDYVRWNEISLWDWKTGKLVTAFPGIANVVSFRGSDEFLYLTPEGHLTRARLPVWIRPPTITGDGVSIEWLGREGTFQLQRRESHNSEWENVGEPTSERSTTVAAEGASGFFRLVVVD